MKNLMYAAAKFDIEDIKAEIHLNGKPITLTLKQAVGILKERDNKDAMSTLDAVLKGSTVENINDRFEDFLGESVIKGWLP